MNVFELPAPELLRAHLARSRRVYEPRSDSTGTVHWLEAGTGFEARFDPATPLAQYSPKQFFFAEREALHRFDGREYTEILPETGPQALFGVRACDLTAIAYQDRFFRDDPHYQARRRAMLLVGIDCLKPCERGFCPTVDAGPFVREGTADLVLHQSGPSGRWLIYAQSEAGQNALEGLSLIPATGDPVADRSAAEQPVIAAFPDASHVSQGVRLLNEGKIRPETWDQLGIQCFACSGCTSLCPTCSCFATYERPLPDGGQETQRCWDSCLYEGFQKEASGHHPQPTAGQRVFRYWYHKFSDDYLPEFGRHGCVGCGRCEQTCLGVIGVHSIMKRIVQESAR